ncbi:hypothetical protein BCR44DRAFT_118079 [Catenaria anguillulae PL171]|uniref:tRNA (uracil-O(2)-)-methyltransferase n=1 Tax=Catenaria anguillulae PL171 TaxID=765915 RepID=A0A1Y2HPP2_9FUNG|nr:hypothetical protein BCR44DRAFT_118079 [Catenaria anguillulae PL171]
MGKQKKQLKNRVDPYFMMLNPQPIASAHGYVQDVVFSLPLFHQTMLKWMDDPSEIQHIYSQFATFSLDATSSTSSSSSPVDPTTQNEHLTRRRTLMPKGPDFPHVCEQIEAIIDWSANTASYTFSYARPALAPESDAPPPNYFQVQSFTFRYAPLSPTASDLSTALQAATSTHPAPAIAPGTQLVPTARISIHLNHLPPTTRRNPAALRAVSKPYVYEDLLRRAYKWTVHAMLGGYTPVAKDVLVARDVFAAHYKALKKKYAYLLTSWTESTDPQKFVYEDVALTAYLTLLWVATHGQSEAQAKREVVFADLGCGNGLLTYLLTMEGYRGYGVDIRARKIWPRWREECPQVVLVESTLDLQTYALPADVTWVIGNHADELCPWIAELAMRPRTAPIATAHDDTSIAPHLFVLPCCFYNREGNLFAPKASSFPVPQHLEAAGSRYKRYLQYIGELCDAMGFDVTYDALRIPSTKNQALICKFRGVAPKSEQLQVTEDATA